MACKQQKDAASFPVCTRPELIKGSSCACPYPSPCAARICNAAIEYGNALSVPWHTRLRRQDCRPALAKGHTQLNGKTSPVAILQAGRACQPKCPQPAVEAGGSQPHVRCSFNSLPRQAQGKRAHCGLQGQLGLTERYFSIDSGRTGASNRVSCQCIAGGCSAHLIVQLLRRQPRSSLRTLSETASRLCEGKPTCSVRSLCQPLLARSSAPLDRSMCWHPEPQ